MVLKRQFGEDGSDNSLIPNLPQSPPAKFRKVVNYVMREASLQEIATKISAILEPTLRRVVREEVENLLFLQSPPRRSLVHQSVSFNSRGLQLHFTNKLPSTLFTNSKIEAGERNLLQITLVDAKSKNTIQHGSLSSLKVEIVVLSADFVADEREDWSESEFNASIVREREGKRPLLVGELSFSLICGVGVIGNIAFTDNSSWVRSRKFRLGVRALSSSSSSTAIREAVSDAFVVLDHRGESYQKHNTPSLDDPVWRLKKISRLGASHNKLEAHGIKTVKDFLMLYHMDPSLLRNVLGKGVANRAWETMLKHANECHLENTLYSFYDAAERVELLFNCVYKLIAVKFEGQEFHSPDALNLHEKALVEKVKLIAFSNQNQLVPRHHSAATPPFVPATMFQQSIPFSTPNLESQNDGLSVIDQDEAEKQLDFNLSDSASYPCTIEDGYLPEEDSTAQSDQPMEGFSPATLLMGDITAEPSDGGAYNNWYQNTPITTTFAQNTQFGIGGQLTHPQNSPLFPLATTTWEQGDDGFLTTTMTTGAHHIGIFSQLPNFGVNFSGSGKSKAGWCKIRAAVMWKIVRRNVAARRKANLPFCFY